MDTTQNQDLSNSDNSEFNSPVVSDNTSNVSGNAVFQVSLDGQKKLRLERFAKSAKEIVSQSVAYLRAELERLPSISVAKNEKERQVLVNSLFLARYGKFPQEYEEVLLEDIITKFVQTL